MTVKVNLLSFFVNHIPINGIMDVVAVSFNRLNNLLRIFIAYLQFPIFNERRVVGKDAKFCPADCPIIVDRDRFRPEADVEANRGFTSVLMNFDLFIKELIVFGFKPAVIEIDAEINF